jgi:hypothetical protein
MVASVRIRSWSDIRQPIAPSVFPTGVNDAGVIGHPEPACNSRAGRRSAVSEPERPDQPCGLMSRVGDWPNPRAAGDVGDAQAVLASDILDDADNAIRHVSWITMRRVVVRNPLPRY